MNNKLKQRILHKITIFFAVNEIITFNFIHTLSSITGSYCKFRCECDIFN